MEVDGGEVADVWSPEAVDEAEPERDHDAEREDERGPAEPAQAATSDQ